MQTLRRTTRRSFLTQVAGGGLAIGAGLIFGANGTAAQQKGQPATRQMVVDTDPRDPARPPANPRPSPPGPPSNPGQHTNQTSTPLGPSERFVVCPGNPRCPS